MYIPRDDVKYLNNMLYFIDKTEYPLNIKALFKKRIVKLLNYKSNQNSYQYHLKDNVKSLRKYKK